MPEKPGYDPEKTALTEEQMRKVEEIFGNLYEAYFFDLPALTKAGEEKISERLTQLSNFVNRSFGFLVRAEKNLIIKKIEEKLKKSLEGQHEAPPEEKTEKKAEEISSAVPEALENKPQTELEFTSTVAKIADILHTKSENQYPLEKILETILAKLHKHNLGKAKKQRQLAELDNIEATELTERNTTNPSGKPIAKYTFYLRTTDPLKRKSIIKYDVVFEITGLWNKKDQKIEKVITPIFTTVSISK